MRQSGILAAAGLYALEHHFERLVEDHERAVLLARAFDEIPGLAARPPETNIVLVEAQGPSPDLASLLSFLEKDRILMSKFGSRSLRAVTHLDVDDEGISRTGEALSRWASAFADGPRMA